MSHKHKNEEVVEQPQVQEEEKTKTKIQEEIKKEKEVSSELETLKQELAQQKQLVEELAQKNEVLKIQIDQLNEEYKKQVIEKAVQAQKILDEKIEESKEHYKKEFSEKQKYAIAKDAEKLISVINNFELALKHSPSDPVVKNYLVGFNMILNMFHDLLNDMQIVQVEIKQGDEFNHDFMEVVEQMHSDKYKTNQVIEVLRPAYKLHDRVICFAKVVVAK